jgi:hypothetical protein
MTIWIIKKLTMLILNMALNFMFVCNPKKLQLWQSKLSPYSCYSFANSLKQSAKV